MKALKRYLRMIFILYIVSFMIDGETGLLKATGHVTKVPSPVCLKLVQGKD